MPPRYELLPNSMDQIFMLYMEYRDPYEHNFMDISRRYYFPEVEGLHGDGTVIFWMCQYIALLFLRQYSLGSFIYGMEPVQMPRIPDTQSEKREWMDHIHFFKKLVKEIYENPNLMRDVGLEFLNDDWCVVNHKPKPLDLIESVNQRLSESFETTQIEQPISEEKSKLFYNSSKSILENTFTAYNQIFQYKWNDKEYNSLYIHGEKTFIDKSAFAENQESTHLNFDTYLGRVLSSKFKNGISESFSIHKSAYYLLKPEDLFKAIDRLKLKKGDYVIVSFGLNLSHLKESYKIEELSETHYNGIKIIKIEGYNHHVVGESMFVLKKSDLPYIVFRDLEKDIIQKFHLNQLDEIHNLYGSIIDLNKENKLREEIKDVEPGVDLRKMVLLSLDIKVEIRWKKNIKNIMLTMNSKYTERGLPNKLSDVK